LIHKQPFGAKCPFQGTKPYLLLVEFLGFCRLAGIVLFSIAAMATAQDSRTIEGAVTGG